MADPARTVLLLAGRLPALSDGCPVRALADRLERRGIPAQVLCASGGEGAGRDPRVVECPGLGHRWGRRLAVRRLPFDEGLRRPTCSTSSARRWRRSAWRSPSTGGSPTPRRSTSSSRRTRGSA